MTAVCKTIVSHDPCQFVSASQIADANQHRKSWLICQPVLPRYYHIPGYTGKIPQESQMFGVTRSEMSRRAFLDPSIYTRPETLFAPRIDAPSRAGDKIRAHSTITDQIYRSDMIVSGYDGHIPTMHEKFGQTDKDLFLAALSDFEDDQTREKDKRLDFQWQRSLERGAITKSNVPPDSLLHYGRERMPLIPISRTAKPFERKEKDWSMSVYKMCNDHCDKRFISGYQGHCPRLSERSGQTYHVSTHEALNEFTDAYRQQAASRRADPRFSLVQSTAFSSCQSD